MSESWKAISGLSPPAMAARVERVMATMAVFFACLRELGATFPGRPTGVVAMSSLSISGLPARIHSSIFCSKESVVCRSTSSYCMSSLKWNISRKADCMSCSPRSAFSSVSEWMVMSSRLTERYRKESIPMT